MTLSSAIIAGTIMSDAYIKPTVGRIVLLEVGAEQPRALVEK